MKTFLIGLFLVISLAEGYFIYTILPKKKNNILNPRKVKNKLMEMPVLEFEKYMEKIIIFIIPGIVEMGIRGSEAIAIPELQVKTYAEFRRYFSDIIPMIDLYYGKSYVENFFNITFNQLRLNGVIDKFIKDRGLL